MVLFMLSKASLFLMALFSLVIQRGYGFLQSKPITNKKTSLGSIRMMGVTETQRKIGMRGVDRYGKSIEWGAQDELMDVDEALEDSEREKIVAALTADYTEEDMTKIEQATLALEEFCSSKRLEKFNWVLSKRTLHSTFVFENPSNVNNVWACLRSLDSFGVQSASVIVDPKEYEKKYRAKNMKVAMGTSKWLTLKEFPNTKECVKDLKQKGYRILASDLQPDTKPLEDFDWSQKTALVIGNEEYGISEEMRALADGTFQIPMAGFAESLNMSVACAVLLSTLRLGGGLPPGLPDAERKKLYLLWMMRTVNASEAILRKKGVELPKEFVYTQRILGYKTTPTHRRHK